MPPLHSESSAVVVCCDENDDYTTIMHSSQDEHYQSSSSQQPWWSSSSKYVEEFDNDVSRRRCSSDLLLMPPYHQSKEQPQRQRRVVRFNEEEQVQPTISRTEYTEQEISECWFEPQDYIEFKEDVALTVYLMSCHEVEVDDIMYTSRGAECRITEIWQRRHQWRLESKQSVLEIEQQLRLDNIDLEKGIPRSIPYDSAAYAYWEASQPAVYEAIDIASNDRIDADSYYNAEEQQHNDDDDWLSDDWISSVSTSESLSFSLDDDDDFETTMMKPDNSHHHLAVVGLTRCVDSDDVDDDQFCDSWIREVSSAAVAA